MLDFDAYGDCARSTSGSRKAELSYWNDTIKSFSSQLTKTEDKTQVALASFDA